MSGYDFNVFGYEEDVWGRDIIIGWGKFINIIKI